MISIGTMRRLLLAGGASLWLGAAVTGWAGAVRLVPGFTANTLPANDDESTGLIQLPFTVNFFGTNFPSLFVNNNGNITFDQSLSTFTPFGLTGTVRQIIAPFFADVDTRGTGSGLVTYGTNIVNGRVAFGVNWINVGYFPSGTDRLNSFQLVLIDRSDSGTGDFDIEFNYDRIQWETGGASGGTGGLGGNSARAGFSNGSGQPGTFFELPGSGVNGAFLDSNPSTGLINNQFNSSQLGRYVFEVRNGQVQLALFLTKNAAPDPTTVGSNLTYTITVANGFPAPVDGVRVVDTLPTNVTFVAAESAQGSCTVASNVVTCQFGTLPVNGTASATITVTPNRRGDICNTAQVLSDLGAGRTVIACSTVNRPRGPTSCVTRDARFWFTHAFTNEANCATLLAAIEDNGGALGLGYVNLPVEYRDEDNDKDAVDAMIEALGFYYRSVARTGEEFGSQNLRRPSSALCRERKRLAVEMIAAIANTQFLGTFADDCAYTIAGGTTNFPVDIVQQARVAASGDNLAEVRAFTLLLKKFNRVGITQPIPADIANECSGNNRRQLLVLARDPTTQLDCGGINDRCETAESIISFPFVRSVSLVPYLDEFPSPSCNSGGRDAVWRIKPSIGVAGAEFTVSTAGSNFDTVLSVWRGNCQVPVEVTCNDNHGLTRQSLVRFTTDGQSDYFIVAEGANGAYGRLKLQVTSP